MSRPIWRYMGISQITSLSKMTLCCLQSPLSILIIAPGWWW